MKDSLNITVAGVAAAVIISLLACTLPKDGPQTDNSVYDPGYNSAESEPEDSADDASADTDDTDESKTVNLGQTRAKPAPGVDADRLDILTSGLEKLRKMVRARTTDPTRWAELVPEGQQLRYRAPQPDGDQKLATSDVAETMSAAYGAGICVPAQAECFSNCCSYKPGTEECKGSAQTVSAACFKGDSADSLTLNELWMRCPVHYAVEDIDAKPDCLTDFEVRTDATDICTEDATLQLFMKNNCSASLQAGKQKIGSDDKTGFVLGKCKDERCDFKIFGTAGAKPLDIKVRVRARANAPSNFEAELVKARVR